MGAQAHMTEGHKHMPFDNTDFDPLAMAKETILHNFSPSLVINSLLLLGRLCVPVRKIYSEIRVLTHFAFYAKYPEQKPPQELLYLYLNHRDMITVYQCRLVSYTPMPNMMSEHMSASNMMELIYEVIEATAFSVTYEREGRRVRPPSDPQYKRYPDDPNERMENIGRPSDDLYYRKKFFEGFDPDPLSDADKKG